MIAEFGKDYELLDTGGFEKLERFGQYVLRRPEPQAVWPKSLSESEWQKADAWFKRQVGNDGRANRQSETGNSEAGERGQWLTRPNMPGQWQISYPLREGELHMRLGMTSFKHVGIFPEQSGNWNFICDAVNRLKEANPGQKPAVLNLFAYTGGASLAACMAGADVTHLDSVRQTVSWANENMQLSHLDHIRWLVEDAMVYVQREARRGKRYQGIILDPPAYGRGPKGEKWILEEQIAALMEACRALLDPKAGFIVLNLYSMGFSQLVAGNLLRHYFPYAAKEMETGELCMRDRSGNILPLSVFSRFLHIDNR